jgi:hypothetical protein
MWSRVQARLDAALASLDDLETLCAEGAALKRGDIMALVSALDLTLGTLASRDERLD